MTSPEKDEVLESSEAVNPSAGSPSSPSSARAHPAAPEAAGAPAEAEVVEEEIVEEDADAEAVAKAKAEVADWQDKYMRLHAEWDTYRRRMTEQRAEEKLRATEKLVEGLLPVIDDFERTISYATDNGETGLLDGVKAVMNKLVAVLEKDGVQVISPEGEAFDALECQAVATVDDPGAFDETVAQVYQKGYRMGKKVLRPAMVTVTTGGPKRPQEDKAE